MTSMGCPSVNSWAARVLSGPTGPSTKRHLVAAAVFVLCLVTLALGFACAWWVSQKGDLGMGAGGALLSVAATLGGLTGNAYRKPDGPPPTESQS